MLWFLVGLGIVVAVSWLPGLHSSAVQKGWVGDEAGVMATPLEGKLSRRGRPEDEKMDEGAFQKRLGELVDEIKALPKPDRDKLALLAEETKQRHQELKKTVNNLHESIDFLRLSIKYLLFDLEATRRENGYLRKMLEEQAGS